VVRYTTNRQRTDRNSRERTLTIGYWLPKELSYLNNYKTNSLRLIEAELCEESPNTFLDNIKKYVTQENGIANCGAVFDYTA
jgi:hypothetical protein